MQTLPPKFSLSIVSHGHQHYLNLLMADLVHLGRSDIEVILTLNVPEAISVLPKALPFAVKIRSNASPQGFAANHNAAFAQSCGQHFVILNPDIRLDSDPFDILSCLLENSPDSIFAPTIVNDQSEIEDSARSFPTPYFLLKKFGHKVFSLPAPGDAVPAQHDVLMPDWVAGMFMVVPRAIYRTLHGLNPNYHMYYEDVDFCARARLAVGSSRVDLQACKLEYSIVSPK